MDCIIILLIYFFAGEGGGRGVGGEGGLFIFPVLRTVGNKIFHTLIKNVPRQYVPFLPCYINVCNKCMSPFNAQLQPESVSTPVTCYYSQTSPFGHHKIKDSSLSLSENQDSYNFLLYNTDTSIIRALRSVPLLSLLKRFHCFGVPKSLSLLISITYFL